MSPAGTSSQSLNTAHIDIHDRESRTHWASRLGVTDERLRKAVRLVGSRVSSVSAYLSK